LGIAQITVPLVIKKDTLGRAELREQVTLQPHTQKIMGLSSSKVNTQPICLVEPTNGIGIVGLSIAQESAAEIYPPRFRTGEEQRDYLRPNGYGNRHRSYLPNRIRASPTNFLSENYRPRTQNYCLRDNSFAQNNKRFLREVKYR